MDNIEQTSGPTNEEVQVRTTFAYALGSNAVLANGFQLIKVEGHLRVSFVETGHPAIPAQPRGAQLLPDQVAKDLAKSILEFYQRTEEMEALNAANTPSGVN